jgi:large subunit ribosomal protein L18
MAGEGPPSTTFPGDRSKDVDGGDERRHDVRPRRHTRMSALQDLRTRRKARLRFQLRHKSGGRPRLSVFRSGKNIYAQVIDDSQGRTVAAASTLDKSLRETLKTGADKAAAAAVGKLVAERAVAAGIKDVVFDRGAYLYHGRVKALADAAREGGLAF